ncbi:MAG: NAD-dependent epimerase/dehydratase family protein, partial [Bacteroidota bacterium]
MKHHLISGGCGFVGRNMAKHLYRTTQDLIIIVDDLSVGLPPSKWIGVEDVFGTNQASKVEGDIEYWGKDERVVFWKGDFRHFLRNMMEQDSWLRETFGFTQFNDVFHYAAIVGGRAKIDGDPMMVALDLAIDAELFYWAVRHKPDRLMYPSSSAAYPVNLQAEGGFVALKEADIDFAGGNLGKTDKTYGRSQLTGENLAR